MCRIVDESQVLKKLDILSEMEVLEALEDLRAPFQEEFNEELIEREEAFNEELRERIEMEREEAFEASPDEYDEECEYEDECYEVIYEDVPYEDMDLDWEYYYETYTEWDGN